MGVMACDRRGCENVMCNRYSSTYGYICSDCYEELEAALTYDGNISLVKFMETSRKPEINSINKDVAKFLDYEFRDLYNDD